jgi:hypothetical protein
MSNCGVKRCYPPQSPAFAPGLGSARDVPAPDVVWVSVAVEHIEHTADSFQFKSDLLKRG